MIVSMPSSMHVATDNPREPVRHNARTMRPGQRPEGRATGRPWTQGAGLALGSAASGLLAYVFFATVTRSLGSAAAAPVSVLWAYWSLAGAALSFPLQHWIARTVARRHSPSGSGPYSVGRFGSVGGRRVGGSRSGK